MNQDLPWALIIGIEHFAAKKLAEEISSKDINVIGVGYYVGGLNEIKNFTYATDLSEVENNSFNYVFDFRGEVGEWNEVVESSEKITLIRVNEEKSSFQLDEKLKNLGVNWRIVESFGVYGPGMEIEGKERGVEFLISALKQAVSNKNLILPPIEEEVRLLSVADLVEAILRASFLSGTEEETFLVAGEKIKSSTIAEVLINEAKMTRFKVMSQEMDLLRWNEEKLIESQKKLRWQPKIDFSEGVTETLQYFFMCLDEENRKKPVKKEETKLHINVEENKEEFVLNKIEKKKNIFEVVPVEWDPEPKSVDEDVVEEEFEPEEKEPEIISKWPELPKFNSKLKSFNFDEIEEEKKEEPKIVEEEMDKVNVEEKIEIKPTESIIKKSKKINFKINRRYSLITLGVILLMLLSWPISWGVKIYNGIKSVKTIESLIENKKYSQANKLVKKEASKMKSLDNQIDDWGLNGIGFIRNIQIGVKTIGEVLEMEKNLVPLAESSETLNAAIFQDKDVNWNKELDTVQSNMSQVITSMGVVQARLSGDWSWIPAAYKVTLQKETANLNQMKNYLDLASKSVKLLPELIGIDGKKREYLVLLQNENELRPSGGFIGSYGILSFQGGKLLNFEVKDIYEADGQLQGHVEPPSEIKSYLGEAAWFMRDANWNPNFPDTSVDLQWFLEKETNRKVDGVIGIDLAVAKSILGAVGEVYVPDFKEKINKDNLYEQAEFYAETKFFPGSNQKASFLGALGKQLFESIRNLKTKQSLSLMEALLQSLESNDIQVALNKSESAKVLTDLGWDGAMYQGKCEAENCFNDYLYIVEANLGVNKANYFLYRNMEETVDISDNLLNRSLKINYENTAKNTNWPGGNYKNYLRVYLPKNADITEVSVMDVNDTSSKKTYSNSDLKIKETNNKKEVGFLVEVPVLKRKTVIIKYSSSIDLNKSNKFSYVNYVQRQPGFGDTGLVTLISFPNAWQPTQVQPNASLVGGKLLFNNKLDKDMKMGVELSK